MTLVEVDPNEIVEGMFTMLERLMDGGAPPSQPVLIPPRLVEHHGLRIARTTGREADSQKRKGVT